MKNKSTILFTNDTHRFISFCTKFIYLEEGEISATGSKEDLSTYSEFDKIKLEGELYPSCNPKNAIELDNANEDLLISKNTNVREETMKVFEQENLSNPASRGNSGIYQTDNFNSTITDSVLINDQSLNNGLNSTDLN